ncbi:MAG: flavodoxin-dependent (E)-4-hydroxy-3-methylbut-2-enyl-diphosphate synthase [Elusimicrobiota bacterium]
MIKRQIFIGDLAVGGDNPPRVQGMLKSSLEDGKALAREAAALVEEGAQMIRCAIPRSGWAEKILPYLKEAGVPLIADCHFREEAPLEALEAGFDKVRLNPGNMREKTIMKSVEAAQKKGAALRLGFNTGSCRARSPEELASFALQWDEKIKKKDFKNFLVSMKSSSVSFSVEANRFFSAYSDTPLHVGITAAGGGEDGILKSAVGIGSLLLDSLADTLRVSITGPARDEVRIACRLRDIALGNSRKLEIISCPGCSRSRVDVAGIAEEFRKRLSPQDFNKQASIAIMGCEVNGPGEAKECDMGICGTERGALLISRGEIKGSLEKADIINRLVEEVRKL